MALAQVGLGTVKVVSAGSTAAVYTVGSAKTAYVRAIVFHNMDATFSTAVDVHLVPNVGGSVGSPSTNTRFAALGISTTDTYFFECAYPITLNSTNDTIQVYNKGSNSVNVIVLGDREA